jgi:hypothetical protein
MNNLNDNQNTESKRIAIKALLNSSDSCERVAINELLTDDIEGSKKITINELINQTPFAVASLTNVRIIPKPNAKKTKTTHSYAQALMLNIEKPTR